MHYKLFYSIKWGLFFVIGFSCSFLFSCSYFTPKEEILVEYPIHIGTEPIVIDGFAPFKRNGKSAAINFYLAEAWIQENGKIKILKTNQIIGLEVKLYDLNGAEYTTESFGMSGDTFYAAFSYLPKNVRIKKLVIKSTEPITISKVSWYCYNPM